ncbi:MAG TPA: ATP-dependent DNA helicase [Paenisporosarcina sp.]|nr:ATP-dependent DNA helicase [Paenisporosarcina sp.]
MEYSVKQNEAITISDKNLRIIACAGSGKTRTVAGKVAYLLDPRNGLNLRPENIIAFTYTEKAAAELKAKILDVTGETLGLANMYVGTIHGWCLKALQENEYKYQSYSVLDEIKLKLFIDKNYQRIGMKEVTKLKDPHTPLRRFIDTSIFVRIMDIIRESNLKPHLTLPDNLKLALEKYEDTLNSKKFFDFSMIMDKALDSLTPESNLTKRLTKELKYLIVDEYQDVNPIQEKLIHRIREITGSKLVVVGDDDQNIYQWRGSNNKYIINFDKNFPPKEFQDIPLELNYRSSEGITRLAETLIKNNEDRIKVKKMDSDKKQVFEKGVDILYNEYENVDQENEAIARYIVNLLEVQFSDEDEQKRGLAYSDFCILVRKWNKAGAIASALERHKIPYITAGVNQLFNTPEVEAAMGIFNYLYEDITADDLKNLWLNLPNQRLNESKLDAAIMELEECLPENEKIKKNWEYSLQGILWDFMDTAEIYEDSFIDTYSKKVQKSTSERAEILFFNLGKFSQVVSDFEEVNFNSSSPANHLFGFLSFVTYVASDYYPEGWLNNAYKTPNAVQIMTIHQAKGLEFPAVIIPGLNKNYIPAKKKGGLNEWHFLDRSLIEEQERYEGDKEKEDERRLLYVAITRSQKYLLITRAPDLSNQLYREESMFAGELQKANVLVQDKRQNFSHLPKSTSKPKERVKNITLDFTTLKDYFDCPYRFKLVTMYGFRFPLNQRMGVGRSFHNCLMEIHKRAMAGQELNEDKLEEILERQMHFPYANPKSPKLQALPEKVSRNVKGYYDDNKDSFGDIVFVEQDIQYKLDENILVIGRIDLIKKRKDSGKLETTIIEFKSDDEPLASKITKDQLKLYALGHRELTGEQADYIMTYVIGDNKPKSKTPEKLHERDLDEIEGKIKSAVDGIRGENFMKVALKDKCASCYQNRLCKNRKIHNVKIVR